MRTHSVIHFFAAAAVLTCSAALASPTSWQDKVDPSVLTDAAAGPTEFLVYLEDQADLGPAAALATKNEKGIFVYQELRAVAAATQAPLLAELTLLGVEHKSFWVSNLIWVRGELPAVQAMAANPAVQHVYASGYGRLHAPVEVVPEAARPNASRAVEGNLTQVNADDAWALGFRGQGVVVAGADTGVYWEHASLKEKYRGWDGVAVDHNYNFFVGAAPNALCSDSNEACDDDEFFAGGHGTHTVGTMVGDDGGANQIGMAPDAEWIACRNMNNGVGTIPSYLSCMEWLIAPTETDDLAGLTADPTKAPHVVNNSWGCVEACPPPALEDTLDASVAAGIVYVVSAGNDGPTCSTLAFPIGIYENAFSVGATNHLNDSIASFSSRGPILTDPTPAGADPRIGPNISAPGVNVRSALRDGGYAKLSGTSMAGPHVAGLVALIISANPDLAGKVAKIRRIITDTSVFLASNQGCGDDTNTSRPNNMFGHGRIDALAAVVAAHADTDGDGVTDVLDNCSLVANPSQCDTDGDGFGNHCDADLNQSGSVNTVDLGMMKTAFLSAPGSTEWNADADLNCNGNINTIDLGMMKSMFLAPPGPGETHPVQ